MSTEKTTQETFEDEIAAIAAGESDAVERHIERLSSDDEARDLRHDVTQIADQVAALGDDYEHPADFTSKLLDAAGSEDVLKVDASVKTPNVAKLASTAPANSNQRPLLWAGGGAAAAFLLVMGGMQLTSDKEGSEADVGTNVSQDVGLMSAEITGLDRSSKDGISGITVQRAGQSDRLALEVGGRLQPGDIISTDSRSRVILSLSDTSTITLAANSILLFDAEKTRSVALKAGELVADVAHLEDGPHAIYGLPSGHVEVLGTKFSLSADGEHGDVRVSRGIVALHDTRGSNVKVHAGEEGFVDRDTAPSVSPALYLSDSMRWAEFGPDSEEDRGGSGLGELRAYKPGQSRDTDWPMVLQHHKVTVRVVGNIARTEIEEVFRNDSKTVLEGVYTFPLPAGAQIDTLALDVDGKFEEGAIVEKGRAAKIWKGVIAKATHKKPKRPTEMIWVPGPWKDPALLEWKAGNRFQLRIFPIPKEGTRTVKLAYTQVIPPQGQRRRYTYNLPRSADGSSVAENFVFDMRLGGSENDGLVRTPGYDIDRKRDGDSLNLGFAQEAFVPNGDLVVDYRSKGQKSELQAWGFQGPAATPPSLGYRGKNRSPRKEVLAEQERIAADSRGYALIALRPHLPRWTQQRDRDFIIVIDSSQSMVGERFSRASRAAGKLLAGLTTRDRAVIMACDLDCQTYENAAIRPGAETARGVDAWLKGIVPAGASFMENSLEQAATAGRLFAKAISTGRDSEKREQVVVYIGDGMSSMGHRSLAALGDITTELRTKHGSTFTTVAIGADSDSRVLSTIARNGGGYFIDYKSGRKPSHMAEAVLETTMGVALRDAEVLLPKSMSDVSPVTLGTLRAGDELLMTARYETEIDDVVTIRGTVGGTPYENTFPIHLALRSNAGNAFVPKIWASQSIERLETKSRAGNKDTIVALSKAYGVMSKETSLLVLESEAMFKAFGVDRAKALAQWTGEEGEAESSESMGVLQAGLLGGLGYSSGEDQDSMLATGTGKSSGALATRSANSTRDTTGAWELADKTAEQAPPAPPVETATLRKEAKRKSRRLPAVGRRGPGSWMRRVWFRTAAVETYFGTPDNVLGAIERGEQSLLQNPDSRQRHRDLIQALSYAGDLGRAEEVAQAWMERDRLDPEALSYLADIAARRGRRVESIRLLSGIVDLRVDDKELHLRLAKAYDRAGDRKRACAHRVILSELDPNNTKTVANAVRCENANGRNKRASSILAAIPVATRGRVEHASLSQASIERIRGDLRIDATWNGRSDLDIAIITPTGKRISWQGGHRRVFAQNTKAIGRETLGLARIRKGKYLIEISRTDATATTPISGELFISILGRRQRIPFQLNNASTIVGRASVRMESRMEPI